MQKYIHFGTNAGFSLEQLSEFSLIAMCESGFKPYAIGIDNANAIGFAQIMHTVHRDLISENIGSPDKLFDPELSFKVVAVLAKRKAERGRPIFEDWYNNETLSCIRKKSTKENVQNYFDGIF